MVWLLHMFLSINHQMLNVVFWDINHLINYMKHIFQALSGPNNKFCADNGIFLLSSLILLIGQLVISDHMYNELH